MINFLNEFESIQFELEKARALAIVIQDSLNSNTDARSSCQLSLICMENLLDSQIDKIECILNVKIK